MKSLNTIGRNGQKIRVGLLENINDIQRTDNIGKIEIIGIQIQNEHLIELTIYAGYGRTQHRQRPAGQINHSGGNLDLRDGQISNLQFTVRAQNIGSETIIVGFNQNDVIGDLAAANILIDMVANNINLVLNIEIAPFKSTE